MRTRLQPSTFTGGGSAAAAASSASSAGVRDSSTQSCGGDGGLGGGGSGTRSFLLLFFATSFGYQDAMVAAAAKHPDVYFEQATGSKVTAASAVRSSGLCGTP